jgi:SAM-dependent methyltransferase
MPTLDLGCGGNKRGTHGVDIAAWPGVDHVLALGFDKIPYPNDHFDHAWMIQAIEHVPFLVWSHDGRRSYPMVQLLSEVYRVLKPGALFEVQTLEFPDPRAFQDPTHCSIWTRDTIRHFVGARESNVGNHNDELAGLRVPFRLERSDLNQDGILQILLRK